MAEIEKIADNENSDSLIDSIYRKFVRGVSRAIGSTEFYGFFMDSISKAYNEFQFSNRRMIKNVDMTWVETLEEALDAMQNIIMSPRNVIKEEELIVNVTHAKKAGAETVRHLAMHTALVEDFNEEDGNVRPSKLMQRYREDTIGLYENRLVYTTMEVAYRFVKIRHDALLEEMTDEFGAKLKVKSEMNSATERVHMDMYLHVKQTDSILETDKKHGDILGRISRIYRVLSTYMNSEFAQQMSKLPRVSGNINKTNVLKKNPNYKAVLKLWEFLKAYQDVGYTIKVVEQSPEINEQFEENIYRNILFNYLILKGYLEDEESRRIPAAKKEKQKELKPKIIREIIEELTEDYDLPVVEIRKVLIEELTKEQLMYEEAQERLRFVEEQEARRKEEEQDERAKMRAERERLRKEREEEQQRKEDELKLQIEEDRRRSKIFMEEIDVFKAHLEDQRQIRKEREDLWNLPREDFADAAAVLEEEELRLWAMELLKPYAEELAVFAKNLDKQRKLREETENLYRLEAERREIARKERLMKKMMENKG